MMLTRYHLLGTLAAMLTLFFWGAVVHMGLHEAITAIPVLDEANETQLVETLRTVTPEDGIYMGARGILLVVSSLDEDTDTFSGLSFPGTLASQLVVCAVVGLMLSFIVLKIPGTSVLEKGKCLALIGLAAGIFISLPGWIWFGLGPRFTIVNIVDIVGGWFLAGLVLATLAKRTTAAAATTEIPPVAEAE
jgi:hypothetical protein